MPLEEELQPPLLAARFAEVLSGAVLPRVAATKALPPHHLRAREMLIDAVDDILAAAQTCAANWRPESDRWVQLGAGHRLLYDMHLRVEQALILVLDHARRPTDVPFVPDGLYQPVALVLQRGPLDGPGAALTAAPEQRLGISLILGQPSTRKGILRTAVHLTPSGVVTNYWAISGLAVLRSATCSQFPPSSWLPPAGRNSAVNLPHLSIHLRKLPAYIAA
jgi:hypothetical protein